MIQSFGHVGITVSDLERSLHFYRDVLGLTISRATDLPDGTRIVFLSIAGHGELELFQYPTAQGMPEASRQPQAIGLGHIALRVADLEAAVSQLKERGVAFETEPTAERRRATFYDPDGIPIELTVRPPS